MPEDITEKNIDTEDKGTDEEKTQIISRDNNSISSDEFDKINKKYVKKESIIDKIIHKNKDNEDDNNNQNDNNVNSNSNDLPHRVDDISFRIDKLEGKLEAEGGFRDALNERVSTLTEEIGELRSMILDRERSFNEIQQGFETIQDATNNIQPKKINLQFEKMEKMIIDNTVKSEKTELFVDTIKDELQKYRIQMSKIKSFDNLLIAIDKIKGEMDEINESKTYVDRKTAKVEMIFGELNERLKEFNKEKITIEKVDEITQDLLKNMDKLEIKLEEMVLKEDMDKKIIPLDETIKEVTTKLNEISKTVTIINSKTDKLDVDGMSTIQKEIVGIEHILDSLQKQIVTHKTDIEIMKSYPKTQEEIINKQLSIHDQNIFSELNKIDMTDTKIDTKIIRLQQNIENVKNTINSIAKQISDSKSDIDTIKDNNSSNDDNLNKKLKEQEDKIMSDMDKMTLNYLRIDSENDNIKQEFNYLKKDNRIKMKQNTKKNKTQTPQIKIENKNTQLQELITDNLQNIDSENQKIDSDSIHTETEIIKELNIAKIALDIYNMNKAETSYRYICALLNPLIEEKKTENINNLFKISQELYLVLTDTTKSPETFKQQVNKLTTDLYGHKK